MTDTDIPIQELSEAGEDGGDLMGYFCRGHVADWKFAQAANDYSGALTAYDQRHVRPENVRHVWWRCIPIRGEPGFHRYEPAEPHSRGAFPATVCESVSDAVQVWGQRQQNRWNSGRCRGLADGVNWCLTQLDSINPEAGAELLKRFRQDRAEIEKDPLA